jgi:hypothetical protein
MERPVLSPFPSNDRFSSGASSRNNRARLSSPASNERVSMNASRNPLSLRLYKSLSANFQDAASREALEVLSSLYGDSSEFFYGSRTAAHDEDTSSSHEEDTHESPCEKKGFAGSAIEPGPLGDITVAERARKNSRRDVEQMLIANSIRFLHAFGDVNKVCLPSICLLTVVGNSAS